MDVEHTDLVVRSKGGGLTAFNSIVQRYQPQVLNLSARILGDKGRAEDVTQETFISAYRVMNRFQGGESARLVYAYRRQPQQGLPAGVSPQTGAVFEPVSRGPVFSTHICRCVP